MKETELIRRRVKEPLYSSNKLLRTLLKKWKSVSLCKTWESYAHVMRCYLPVNTVCYDWGFSLIKWSTVLLLLAHITAEPLRSASPATFSNVSVHVRAIWRITWWQLQAWLSWKVSSPNSSPQMLANLWNAERYEVWINRCWHHHSLQTTLHQAVSRTCPCWFTLNLY